MIAVSNGYVSVKGRDVGIEVLLGFASIPVTLALSIGSGPSSINAAPVFVAGLAVGYYYSTRSMSGPRAAVRTGLIGGLPALWYSVDLVRSQLVGSSDYLFAAIAFGVIWFLLGLGASVLFSVSGAVIGRWVSRRF